jgi:hypothetical protein
MTLVSQDVTITDAEQEKFVFALLSLRWLFLSVISSQFRGWSCQEKVRH